MTVLNQSVWLIVCCCLGGHCKNSHLCEEYWQITLHIGKANKTSLVKMLCDWLSILLLLLLHSLLDCTDLDALHARSVLQLMASTQCSIVMKCGYTKVTSEDFHLKRYLISVYVSVVKRRNLTCLVLVHNYMLITEKSRLLKIGCISLLKNVIICRFSYHFSPTLLYFFRHWANYLGSF